MTRTAAADFEKRDGMVLVDNYWVEEADVERYLADREAAALRATAAMGTFCETVAREWAGSEDGEAVVGYNEDDSIRSLLHLDPASVRLVLSLSHEQLVDYLK